MAPRTRFHLRWLLILLAAVSVAFVSRGHWLAWLAYPLIRDDGPAQADVAVVLSGERDGNRIVKGAELVRDGYVSKVLVSGSPVYGGHECDRAIALAVGNGFPADWFIPVPHSGLSTFEEGRILSAEMRRRNIHSFLLVTSDFHTARAGRIFQAFAQASEPRLEMRVVASLDQYCPRNGWWRIREGRKLFFLEWLKLLANALKVHPGGDTGIFADRWIDQLIY
jgi:uncharacterized SAM-binding protein YcdF (DUF218 family)